MVIIMGIFVNKIMTHRKGRPYFKVFAAVFLISALFQFVGTSVTYQDTQVQLEDQYNTPDDKWAARRMMNFDPRWNLITQNMKHLFLSGDINYMYINYLERDDFYFIIFDWQVGSGFPAWVGGTLTIFLITFLASTYLLLRILMTPSVDTQKVEKPSLKKKRRR